MNVPFIPHHAQNGAERISKAESYVTLAPEDAAWSQPAREDSDEAPRRDPEKNPSRKFAPGNEQRPIPRKVYRKFRKAYIKDELRKQEKKLRRRIHQKKKLIAKKEEAILKKKGPSLPETAAPTPD